MAGRFRFIALAVYKNMLLVDAEGGGAGQRRYCTAGNRRGSMV